MLNLGTGTEGRSLARFSAQAAGALLGPFLVQTAFMAFAPSAIGRFPFLVLAISVGSGILALRPRQVTRSGVFLAAVYALVMVFAVAYWTLFVGFTYFRDHLDEMFPHIGEL